MRGMSQTVVPAEAIGEQSIFYTASQNVLKKAYFPLWMTIEIDGQSQMAHYYTHWTFGRRTEEGVSRGDACSIDYGRLCNAVLKAGKEKQCDSLPIEDYFECYVQIVDPGQTIADRKNSTVGENRLTDINRIILGGLPNLDGMKAQSSGIEFDYPYYLKDMVPARIPERGTNVAWNYPESVEEEGINLDNYTWQGMVAGKGKKGPAWNWELLKIFPSGKTRSIFRVDEIPKGGADLLHDAVLVYAGKGVDPYNPEVYAITVVGGRGGSSALGAMIVDNDPKLEKISGGSDFMEQLYNEIDGRPDKSRGIMFGVDDWLQDGQPVKVGDLQKLVYTR